MTNKDIIEEIVKEFEKEHHWSLCKCDAGGNPGCIFEDLRTPLYFLLQKALSQERERIVERVEKMRITKREDPEEDNEDAKSWNSRVFYYNQAIDDLIKIIK